MKCVICRQAETVDGQATLTLERDGLTPVVKQGPAQVCPKCGEGYLDEEIASRILRDAEQVAAPLDVATVDLGVTTGEIVEMIREGRERYG